MDHEDRYHYRSLGRKSKVNSDIIEQKGRKPYAR